VWITFYFAMWIFFRNFARFFLISPWSKLKGVPPNPRLLLHIVTFVNGRDTYFCYICKR